MYVQNSILKLMIYLLYFVSFGLIFSFSFNGEVNIYGGTIFSIVFLLFFCLKLIKEEKIVFYKNEVTLYILSILLISFSLINSLIVDKSLIIISILNMLPIFTAAVLFNILSNERNKKFVQSILNFITLIFKLVFILAPLLYLFGYSQLFFSLDKIITFVDTNSLLNEFDQGRLSWLMTHKSRFGFFCFLGIMTLLINQNVKFAVKNIFIILGFVNIYLSNSATILVLTVFAIVPFLKFNKANKYLKMMFLFTLFTSSIILSIILFNYLNSARDLFTLGGRIYIWQAGLEFIKNYPLGVIDISEQYYLSTNYYGSELFSHSHNQFINEMMRNGILIGTIYIVYYIYINLLLIKQNKQFVFFVAATTIAFLMDGIVNLEMTYIYYFFLPLLIGYCKINSKSFDKKGL